MLVYGKKYLAALKSALAQSKRAALAVAFWGAGADRLLQKFHGKSLRIICNLALGGTNPRVIEQLLNLPNIQVRHLPDLHAKLVLTESHLLIGSANMSANGLGLEQEELASWRQAGMVSRQGTHLRAAKAWFERQWKQAKPVTETDIEAARLMWRNRRSARPSVVAQHSLMNEPISAFEGRPIFLAVYRAYSSPRARKELQRIRRRIGKEQTSSKQSDQLVVFEGWEDEQAFKDPNSILIQVYWGPRGKVAVLHAVRPIPELQSSYFDREEQAQVKLDILVKQKAVGPWPFGRSERLLLQDKIAPWLVQIGLDSDEGRCIPFSEFRQWQFRHDSSRNKR